MGFSEEKNFVEFYFKTKETISAKLIIKLTPAPFKMVGIRIRPADTPIAIEELLLNLLMAVTKRPTPKAASILSE